MKTFKTDFEDSVIKYQRYFSVRDSNESVRQTRKFFLLLLMQMRTLSITFISTSLIENCTRCV